MQSIDDMWTHLPIDRASTPIQKRSSFPQPRTSTPILIRNKYSIQRAKKKKKKKKSSINNDYHRLLYGNIQQKKHSTIQIWFL